MKKRIFYFNLELGKWKVELWCQKVQFLILISDRSIDKAYR